jgi:hypothetical protein
VATTAGVSVILTALVCSLSMAEAAPLRVRLPEGNARGFLVLRSSDGDDIAYGELRQKPTSGLIEMRFILSFKDGSHREETAVYSQSGVFRLERYRLIQRGPSFPTTEISMDRKTGRYSAVTQETKDKAEKRSSGPFEMPLDLYNGMALVLSKNLPSAGWTFQFAAFTPRPRLIKTVMSAEGEDGVVVGGEQKKAIRYLLKLELTGLTGVVAPLIGKEPPETRYWLVAGDIPAFARFEGAMFLNGPVWRLEQTSLQFKSQ